MKISVIVPIFKAEKTLSRCVDSLISQNYPDLEIVLVDDGSPDRCPILCDEYAQKDSRIKVIHQKNAGVSVARNAGLSAVCGDYVSFVDSDDYVESVNYFETLVSLIQDKEKSIDILCFGFQREWNFHFLKRNFIPSFPDRTVLDRTEIEQILLPALFWEDGEKCATLLSVWGKLIRRSILLENKIKFPEDWNHAEDANVSIRCFCASNCVMFSHYCGYHYVRALNFNSLSSKIRPDFFNLELRFHDFLEKNIGPVIHQDYENEKGYEMMIKKAELNACLIANNVKSKNGKEKWLKAIFDSEKYRHALSSLPKTSLSEVRLQELKCIKDENLSEWNKIVYSMARKERFEKRVRFIKKMLSMFFKMK